ncbi:small acid-soluble spore protein Tlp [Aciduricibacillus chroicocephali]|uniref:Small, acid-soluble spore protein Tlp n=1 Tax=Aciduricibacillus chroicocephali TaxID=3054939 RepID=A0ABY9KYM8_9BACI|nr:small acid-soluble spore protein Tlp [Bacillaceae bacterium 44XB]
MKDYNKPKPDDRSDNAEKLASMIEDTEANIRKAEQTMENGNGTQESQIADKNERRREALKGMRAELLDEAENANKYQ